MKFNKKTASLITTSLITILVLSILTPPVAAFAAGDADETPTIRKKNNSVIKKASDKKKVKKKEFVIKCFNKNQIFDKVKKRCVDEAEAQTLNQDSIYSHGRSLARAGQYEDAIRILNLAHDQNDPRVLNYLGFSNRKLGNMKSALTYYHAAVASNPDFTLVREYLGEAYIQLGLLEKAREQLTQIERICGNLTCREYSMLSKIVVDSQLR